MVVLPSKALAASNPALVVSVEDAVAVRPRAILTAPAQASCGNPLDELELEELDEVELLVEDDELPELDELPPVSPPQAASDKTRVVVKKIRRQGRRKMPPGKTTRGGKNKLKSVFILASVLVIVSSFCQCIPGAVVAGISPAAKISVRQSCHQVSADFIFRICRQYGDLAVITADATMSTEKL